MRIEVVVYEWEQACCGAAFRIGEDVTWMLHAADPETVSPDALPRFYEEHHGQTCDDVPHWEVTGTVRRITGVRYPTLPVPGESCAVISDRENPDFSALHGVGKGAGADYSEYRVELEVAADTSLPPFVLSPSIQAEWARAAEEMRRNQDRMADAVGVVLEATADYAQLTYGECARISRSLERSAVTVEPSLESATAVRWARNEYEEDGISVETGDGSWRFPAKVEYAHRVREFLDAAANGRVAEKVSGLSSGDQRLDTVVDTPAGHQWVSSTDMVPFMLEDGAFAVAGDGWERARRGQLSYPAWRATDE